MNVYINRFPVNPKYIIRLAGDGSYSHIHMMNASRPVLMSTHLRLYGALLPDFVRVHKGHLVNPDHIKQMRYENAKDCVLIMSDNHEVPVSKHRLKGLGDRRPTLEQVLSACRNYKNRTTKADLHEKTV